MQSTCPLFNVTVILVFVISTIVIHSANCQSGIYQYGGRKRQELDNSPTYRYCGRELANALQDICKGIYNSMFKKSVQEMEMDTDYPYAYSNYPLRSRASANAMLMGRFGDLRFRRQSRGVHDECCLKSCSMQELMSYCGN